MQIDESFAYLVLSIVAEIPMGMVSTYGDIARLAGFPKHARLVGKVLSQSSSYGDFPCHRVVNSAGKLVVGWDEQAQLLEAEGVVLLPSGCVDMKQYRWRQ